MPTYQNNEMLVSAFDVFESFLFPRKMIRSHGRKVYFVSGKMNGQHTVQGDVLLFVGFVSRAN